MPLDLRQMQARRAELSVQIEGEAEPLVFSFYPHKFTNQTNNRITGSPGLNTLVTELSALMIDWNLTLDGQPFPLTEDSLSQVGLPVLTEIGKAIVQHVTGQDDRKNSNGGSTTGTPVSATAPIGSPSSA